MLRRISFPSIYRLGQIGLDSFIAASACYLAFLIRFEGQIEPSHQELAWWLPFVAIVGRLFIQTLFGLYQQVWRLFGLKDSIALLNAVTFYSLGLLVTTRLAIPYFEPTFQGIPLGVAVIDWAFCLMGMVALRYTRRRMIQKPLFRRSHRTLSPQRILLVGAGMAGSLVAREVQQNPLLNLEIVGFLDDDRSKIGRRVEGIHVIGNISQLVEIARINRVEEVLISMPSAKAGQIRRIFEQTRGASLKLKALPGPAELLRDRSLTPQAREIEIQDILGRPEVHLDFSQEFNAYFPSASEQIHQQTVLVTGAGGTIGSEICRQLARLNPKQLLLLGRGENSIFNIERELQRDFAHLTITPIIANICNRTRMENIFRTWKPDLVFHAAAHKHVPLMQQNPTEAIANNALASANLAQLAARSGVKSFVMISTDKAVDATNFMGLSKRLAELLVTAQSNFQSCDPYPTRFLVVRFGNVLGSRGSVVPIFKAQIARGGPVTVTDREMTRYFMTTPEASQLVIQSLAVGKSGQILILDMGTPVRIYDLAEQMIQLAGFVPHQDIQITFIGLRPGEKLHESLVNSIETIHKTKHPKIMAVLGQWPSIELGERIEVELERAIHQNLTPKDIWAIAEDCKIRLEQ